MRLTITIIATVLACLLFGCSSLLAEKNTLPIQQREPNYVEIIKQKYKDAETNQKVIETWTEGILKEYLLILDHLEMRYTQIETTKTTDEKTLVCGNLLITAYAKTLDGDKKRVISLRPMCHLFNKEILEKTVLINRQANKVINGWDDSILI
jgi:hypothetical protein